MVRILKINRLLGITILLLNRETVTAKELAERFGVSTRTIYRDIDVLSSAGVPVFTNKGNGGGISLLENYSLNKTLISEHESESLLPALKTLKAAKYPEIDTILEKIGAVFKHSETDWVHIDFSPWESTPNEHNKFIEIKKAILDRKRISFEYVSSAGEKTSREIEPMKLIFKGQAWYLWGYCVRKNDFRVFRISRIKNVKVTNEIFKRRNYVDKNQGNETENIRSPVYLKLKFYPQVLHRLYDDFDDEMIVRNSDGTCTVEVQFPEDEWVYGYLLSFGSYVEILEPQHIRDIIADRAKKLLKFYEKS
ncbi:MAG: YafY family transcriptional regulator [Clostridiaceae bacterium]|nr:YafY family transcriptional regulator [Clostridiaceae bacterium]